MNTFMNKEVKIYSLPTWPHCKEAKEFLSKKGIDYIDIDVGKDKAKLKEMREISDGARSVPVIVVCDDVFVGFDRDLVERALDCLEE